VECARETYVENFLRRGGLSVIPARAERTVYRNGKPKKESRPLIPGYVFFESGRVPDWEAIVWFPAVYKPLSYADDSFALRGRDLEFVRSLMKNNGVYKISRAVADGSKIRIVDGPLKDYEGSIVKVNRRKGWALVKIAGEGIINNIWLGFELLEELNERH
jgi:transcriptional antiterminator NusG